MTRVIMGKHHTGLGVDWELAYEMAREEFEQDLDPAIEAWLVARNIPVDVHLNMTDWSLEGDIVECEFEAGLNFDDPNVAMLFKLTFGGV